MLVAVNAAEFLAAFRGSPIAPVSQPPSPTTPETQLAAARPTQPADALVAVILGRPLFEPNRRPVGGATTSGPGAPGLPRIAGIVVSPTSRLVIFAAENGGKPTVVAQGSKLNGFLIKSIEDGAVTVLGPDGSRVLHPSFDPTARTPTPPPRVPGPPGFPRPGSPMNLEAQRPRPPGFFPPSESPNPPNTDD